MEKKQEQESHNRSLIFFGCLIAGLALMIPAAYLHNICIQGLSRFNIIPPGWVQSLTGFGTAFLPMVLLIRRASAYLTKRYPNSPARKIPEAHERPSAHKL